MTNINRTVKCVNCSTDFPISIVTDLDISDIALMGKCPKCGNSMQVHFGVIGTQTPAQPQPAPEPHPIDDSIFMPMEMPSDEIKKLMDE